MLPVPPLDLQTGIYSIRLLDHVAEESRTTVQGRDSIGGFDEAWTATQIDRHLTGCKLDQAIAFGLVQSIALGRTPALTLQEKEGEAMAVARQIVPCEEDGSIDSFQQFPERGLVDRWDDASPERAAAYRRGGSLFYSWFDASFGKGTTDLISSLWALAPTQTAINEDGWNHHPNTFDVLQESFKDRFQFGSNADELWLRFAMNRPFRGARCGVSEKFNPSSVRIDWSIDWPHRPRRLLSSVPLAPTGASYVLIRAGGTDKRLRIEIEWEERMKMRWAVIGIDAQGAKKKEMRIPSQERATETQGTVVGSEEIAQWLVVGSSAGEPDRPIDPSVGIAEPHGWMITLAEE